jgi:hypothetical protein
MTPVIQQRVRFRTSPRALFDLYRDSHRHSLSTGAPATISRKASENSRHLGRNAKARTP